MSDDRNESIGKEKENVGVRDTVKWRNEKVHCVVMDNQCKREMRSVLLVNNRSM